MSDNQRTTYGSKVLDEDAIEAQQAAARTGGNVYGSKVIDVVPSEPTDEPTGETPAVKRGTIKQLHEALAADPALVHGLAAAEIGDPDGPRKGALHALRAIAEAQGQAGDAAATALVTDLDEALATLAAE